MDSAGTWEVRGARQSSESPQRECNQATAGNNQRNRNIRSDLTYRADEAAQQVHCRSTAIHAMEFITPTRRFVSADKHWSCRCWLTHFSVSPKCSTWCCGNWVVANAWQSVSCGSGVCILIYQQPRVALGGSPDVRRIRHWTASRSMVRDDDLPNLGPLLIALATVEARSTSVDASSVRVGTPRQALRSRVSTP